MHRRGVLAFVVVLAVLASPAGGLSAPDADPGSADSGSNAWVDSGGVGLADAADATAGAAAAPRANLTMVVHVHPHGDAVWTVSTYVPLRTDNETAAFRRQAERWENGTGDAGADVELFRRFAAKASAATGRNMRIPGNSVERTAEVVDNGTRGVFRLSFRWTNFARREGDRLVIDDAFRTESGTWLPGLERSQLLVIRPPPTFTFDNAPIGAQLDNGTLSWRGPTEFPESYFLDDPVVFMAGGTDTPSPSSVSPSPSAVTSPGDGTVFPDGSRGLLFGVFAALVLGGSLALYRRLGGGQLPGGTPGGTSTDDPGDGGDVGTATVDAVEESDDPPGTDQADGEQEPTPADPFAGVDEELLADDERVLRLLEANGGRMKQADIVKETGWSNAKVSQLLSSMEDDDDVDKLRIGRENLISLPEVDVHEVE